MFPLLNFGRRAVSNTVVLYCIKCSCISVVYKIRLYCIKCSGVVLNTVVLCQINLYCVKYSCIIYQTQLRIKYSTVVLYCWFENNSDNMIEQNGQKESWWQV